MPLIKSKSKKAFEHNVKEEMEANPGKDKRAQNLAIAYSVKRKAKKASGGMVQSGSKDMNMAEGGMVPSAKSEARPMPDSKGQEQVSRNSGKKAPKNDQWLDQPTVDQAQSNNGRAVKPIKRPMMVPSNAFSTRMYDEEGRLQDSASPGPYDEQPPQHDNEDGPDRQGPAVSDMEHEHSNGRKPYAAGGKVIDEDAMDLRERHDESDLMSYEDPSEDEGRGNAMSRNEMSPDRQRNEVPDMEDEHSNGRKPYARGGEVSLDGEMEMEHHDSIAAAIMARRDRLHDEIDSGAHDLDEAVRMAEGGEINGMDSIYAHPDEDQADLSRNAEEDANMEDESSFDALRKENYSESEGLSQLDNPEDSAQQGDYREEESENKHDMIDSLSRKIAMRRQFKAR